MPVRSESNGPLAVSVAVAATLLGISRSHAYELAASGELPCIRLGRRVLVPMEEITRLLSPQPAPNRLSEAGCPCSGPGRAGKLVGERLGDRHVR